MLFFFHLAVFWEHLLQNSVRKLASAPSIFGPSLSHHNISHMIDDLRSIPKKNGIRVVPRGTVTMNVDRPFRHHVLILRLVQFMTLFLLNVMFLVGRGLQHTFLGPLREMEMVKTGSRIRYVYNHIHLHALMQTQCSLARSPAPYVWKSLLYSDTEMVQKWAQEFRCRLLYWCTWFYLSFVILCNASVYIFFFVV